MVSWSHEEWVHAREMFVFRTIASPRRPRRTFCISRAALEDLCPDEKLDPDECFSRHRSAIYSAAERLANVGDPSQQFVISAKEVRSFI